MRVAYCYRQRICRIVGLWRLGKSEQHRDHCYDLLFLGASEAYDRLLYLQGGIFEYLDTESVRTRDYYPTRLCYAYSRGYVGVKEQFLDRHMLGLVLFYQLADSIKYHR